MGKLERKLSSSQMIILGFAAVILLGALLLMLPVSSKSGEITPFLDCLLTSTSAVCVTGLVVYDTAAHWTVFGQAIIIVLIQIGGMGVITVAAAITMAAGKKISLMQRSTMQDAISAPQVGGIVRFTGFILKGIVIIELLGAAIMAPVFIGDYGFGEGLWMAVFHSISAFCNAGFDIVNDGILFNSLMGYAANPIINLAIMLLIIIGGLGFLTWSDICTNGIDIKRYHMQSKVILTVTSGLILVPTVYFFFFELVHLPFAERFWGALFQAVTPRTAGFNTVDLNAMSETGQMITSLLMIIGGAPGSTAGGMKVTNAFYQRLSSRMERRYMADASEMQKERERLEARNRQIDDMFLSLYTDKAKGVISEQRFVKLTAAMEQEQEENQRCLQELMRILQQSDAQESEVRTFIREIRQYATIQELDETVLNRLISRILVGEVKKVDGQKVQEVRIVYNFVGEIFM